MEGIYKNREVSKRPCYLIAAEVFSKGDNFYILSSIYLTILQISSSSDQKTFAIFP